MFGQIELMIAGYILVYFLFKKDITPSHSIPLASNFENKDFFVIFRTQNLWSKKDVTPKNNFHLLQLTVL